MNILFKMCACLCESYRCIIVLWMKTDLGGERQNFAVLNKCDCIAVLLFASEELYICDSIHEKTRLKMHFCTMPTQRWSLCFISCLNQITIKSSLFEKKKVKQLTAIVQENKLKKPKRFKMNTFWYQLEYYSAKFFPHFVFYIRLSFCVKATYANKFAHCFV